MQTIPAAIKTLLKSKSMVGPDAPWGSVLFSDVIGAVSWNSYSSWRRPVAMSGIGVFGTSDWIGELSVARKTNGSLVVLSCYSAADDFDTAIDVREGEVADVTTLLSGDDTVTGWVTTGIPLCRFGRACVFNVGAGLYMSVFQIGESGAGQPSFGKIYRSPSGNGGDWVLHGTVYSQLLTWTYWYAGWGKRGTAGPPLVLDTGRWVLPGPRYWIYGGYTAVNPAIWTSDDAGATWTQRATFPVGPGGVFHNECHSRRIVETADGTLWFAHDYDWGGTLSIIVYKSVNSGVTWTYAWQIAGIFSSTNVAPTLHEQQDGIGFYVLSTDFRGWQITIRYCEHPEVDGTTTHIGDYGHDHGEFYRILATPFDTDSRLVVSAGNELLGYPLAGAPLRVDTVRVNRDAAALAQRAIISRPNVSPADPTDPGYYSPDRGDDVPAQLNEWHGVIFPGKHVQIRLGYGADTAVVFSGQIDEVVLDTNGPNYAIRMECRDDAWQLLDRAVSDGAGVYKLTYTNRTVEYIVRDALVRAGIPNGDITTEATGITVVKKAFDGGQYSDIIEWCLKVSGFDLLFDEENLVTFFYPTDRQPEAEDEALVLNAFDWTNLANPWAVADSDRVRSAAGGGGVLYSRVTDYEIEYGDPARIRRRVGSTIGAGATVYATYVFAAWSYEEGVDLFRLPYRISRRDIYGKIVVRGQDAAENVVTGIYTYAGAAAYGVPADKVLTVDIPELDTAVKCQAAADQLGNDMIRKSREVEFAVPGNPWLQVGDCVRLRETSTTATEIYRVVGLEHVLDDHGLITQFSGFHYGYTPLS